MMQSIRPEAAPHAGAYASLLARARQLLGEEGEGSGGIAALEACLCRLYRAQCRLERQTLQQLAADCLQAMAGETAADSTSLRAAAAALAGGTAYVGAGTAAPRDPDAMAQTASPAPTVPAPPRAAAAPQAACTAARAVAAPALGGTAAGHGAVAAPPAPEPLRQLHHRLRQLEEILSFQYLPSPLGPLPPEGGPPPDYLALAAIVRDEGPYLREWLSYHRLIGVERFYIYDNESRDDTRRLLEPWIERGWVIYRYVVGRCMQMPAYSDAIYQARFTTRWLALLDADEFLVPRHGADLRTFLRDFEQHPGLGVNWVMFDSNGHERPPAAHGGLVTANYTRVHATAHDREADNCHVKSIINPREVMAIRNAHYAVHRLRQPAVNELHESFYGPLTPYHSTTCIQCNHYYSRSRAEYQRKVECARADNGRMRVFEEARVTFPDPTEEHAILRFVPRLQECLARDWD